MLGDVLGDDKKQNYVLFFSNFCNYSKDVVNTISRKNIRQAFVFICVDNVRPLPPFVDRVPMISCISNKRIYVDDDIDTLIENVSRSLNPQTTVQAMSSLDAISAPMESEFESFGASAPTMNMLDLDNYRIGCTDTNKETRGLDKHKRADSALLEQYIAQRDSEVRIVNNSMNLR